MKIYKRTDRITVKVGELMFKLAPLTLDQKEEVSRLMLSGRTVPGMAKDMIRGTILAVKYSVKDVKGFTDVNDEPYNLHFDDTGSDKILTDECAGDLLNSPVSDKISLICAAIVNNIPDMFTDIHGKKIEGVEIVKENTPPKNATT